MIIYYSGEGSRSNPEITLGCNANLMLTFHDMIKSPTRRFRDIFEARERRGDRVLHGEPVGGHSGLTQTELEGIETKDIPVGTPNSHFLDSGSFTLWTRAAVYAKENKCGEWEFYDTDEFWAYMKSYARFIKKYSAAIDLYTNIDVLPFRHGVKPPKGYSSHKLTWRNQQWLERRLRKYIDGRRERRPVPVVHYGAEMKWLEHYLDHGYGMIGLGGLVGSMARDRCRGWIDRCFDIVCDTDDRKPMVRLHGFGVTGHGLLLRYPWYSVDSTSWTKVGAFGGLLVPHKRDGKFRFDMSPYLAKVSMDSPQVTKQNQHYLTIRKAERRIIGEWLEEIGVPVGRMGKDKEVLEYGVVTRHTERRVANLLFFERMLEALPEYPWPFRSKRQKTSLGIHKD